MNNDAMVPLRWCHAMIGSGCSRFVAKAAARAARGRAATLRSVVAMTAALLMTNQACADEALAEVLARSLAASLSCDAKSRDALVRTAADAALPLPSFPPDVTMRLGEDLTALVRARQWPFSYMQSELAAEELQWQQDALRFIITRLRALRLPGADEIARVRSYPGVGAQAVSIYSREVLQGMDQRILTGVIEHARRSLQQATALCGNAFLPQLLHPCDATPDGQPFGELSSELLEALRTSALLEFILKQPSFTSGERSNDEFIADFAEQQVQTIMDALMTRGIRCLGAEVARLAPPTSLEERRLALDQRRRDSTAAVVPGQPPEEHQPIVIVDDDGEVQEVIPRRMHSQPGAISYDDALRELFEGTGVSVVHGTALLPRSWRPDARFTKRAAP